ncbi:hypothetical protein C8R43DRAFT_1118036 [Mycena crocata]|nr:hypothetical protein C8R43DRAFT_1118036 [Mycena crocata]
MPFPPDPPYYVFRKVLLYVWGEIDCRIVDMLLYPDRPITLDNQDGIATYFTPNPASCALCLKPHFKIPSKPDFSYTLFLACTHLKTEEENCPLNLSLNKTVGKLLPDPRRTCRGNVVVVKHALTHGVSNKDLPIVDMGEDDIRIADEIVRRWVDKIYKDLEAGLPSPLCNT